MKILFIKPPNHGFYHEIVRYYPVGLAYLAAACRENGFEVKIFDSLVYTEDNCILSDDKLSEGQIYKKNHHPSWNNIISWGASYKRIEKKIREEKPDVVSITAMHSPMYDTAYKIAEIAKEINFNIKVIMGGSHPSIAPEHVLRRSQVDYVLMGEGEDSIVELMKCISERSDPVLVDGIAYRIYNHNRDLHEYRYNDTDYSIHINPKKKWIHNLDKLPFPAADLLEMKRYNHVTIITSRGCPNNCSFCTVHPTVGRVHRARSVENVIAEIKYYIKKFGIKVFNIEDDNFAFDFNRANDILDCLIKLDEDLTLNLPNGMTAINIDENMIKKYGKLKMKDSFIGLETTSEERLKKISKTFTSLDKVQHITELFNKYGMDIGASLVVGFPEQTIDQMIDDIVKLMQHNIKFGTANPCYPIPKSRLYEECLEQGFVDEKMDYTWYDEFNFPLETDLFTRKDIYELWNCSLVYAIYPAMLEVMKNGFNSMNNLLEAFSRFGYGEMYKSEFDSEVYYCVPLYKNTFSCMMKLSEQNDNENVFVDDWTCDILSNLCTLYTGINYEVYQAESALVPNGRNAFIIKQSGKISNIKTKLIGAIHKCEDK